jgi:uncharacterized membrane protein YgdD (TMEM256/DUF423 family)
MGLRHWHRRFSDSLYIMSLTGITRLGMIPPFGDPVFIAEGILLAATVLKPAS